MDKIKKFLEDNKGCPLSNIAIKQLLVKFIESLSDEGLGDLLDLAKPENVNKVIGIDSNGNIEATFPSSLTLLGYTKPIITASMHSMVWIFNNVNTSKITQKTLLIFTYEDCFVLGMVGQSGQGKVAGLIRIKYTGTRTLDYIIHPLNFTINENEVNISALDCDSTFTTENSPIAYLFAMTIK